MALVMVSSFTVPIMAGGGSPSPFYGDVDGNGKIDMGDVVGTERCILGMETSPEIIKRTDVNGNGKPDMEDIVLIERYILGIITIFPIEMPVSLDLTTPKSSQLIAGTIDVEFAKIKLINDLKEDISVNQIQIAATFGNSSTASGLKNICLWDNSTQIGNVASLDYSGKATFCLSEPLIISPDGIETLTIRADVNQFPYSVSGGIISLDIPIDGISYNGVLSQKVLTTPKTAVFGNKMFIYKTKLIASVNSSTPAGQSFSGIQKTTLTFNVVNDGSYDAGLNRICFRINYSPETGSATTQDFRILYLYDTIDLTKIVGVSFIPPGRQINNSLVDIILMDNYTIPAASTKIFVLTADTRDCGPTFGENIGSIIQFYIASGADFVWSDNAGTEVASDLTKNFPLYGGILRY
jgi:hypothetical protein